mgnify:FL=1
MRQIDIGIIGLGFIGGSLAKALHEKLGCRNIVAVDADPRAIELALKEGTITDGFTALCGRIYSSGILFICTPVSQAIGYIRDLAGHIPESCVITDVCSTKEEITRYVEAMPKPPCFIGGHPMAGAEKSGYASSNAHLFENAWYVLTPCTGASPEALGTLAGIVKGIGGIPVIMSAREHDRVTGSISHLPHIAAAALVNLVVDLDSSSGEMRTLAAGGFRDITRIASSNPALWGNIVTSNKTQILELMTHYRQILDDFAESLEKNDNGAIVRFFSDARQYRDSLE